jgi:anion-transporting  ArsA/GET3 family ATPase
VDLAALLKSRLILVTGKGGTGKSSLASSLASLSAAGGKKTIVAEIDSFQTTLDRTLGVAPKFKPRKVRENLYCCNITWKEALNDWLRNTISAERIVRMILRNRVVQLFLDATPGVRETVILSRIHNLTKDYDQVVVDMPASGHALSILRVPHIATGLLGGGPIRERSEEIIKLLGESSTAICLVCLPEEMVVNETIELWEKLEQQNPEIQNPMVVLNRSAAPTSTEEEDTLLSTLSALDGLDEAAHEVLLAGRLEGRLEKSTAEATERLTDAVSVRILSIPRLGAQGGLPAGSLKIVEQMQVALERARIREQR